MPLRQIADLEIANKRVLLRVDFNVPLDKGAVTDDTRIRAALPTIYEILTRNPQRLIILTHVGRPQGARVPALSVRPIAERLSSLLGQQVIAAEDCIGPRVEALLNTTDSTIVMVENVRFYGEETKNDKTFSAQLAGLGDVFINDAFGAAHRAHASTEGVAHHLPSAAGRLIEKEIRYLAPILSDPQRPLVAIIGGAKISTKFAILSSLLRKVDSLIIGGGMAYTFLKAQGHSIGDSLYEQEQLTTASNLLQEVNNHPHLKLLLPADHVVVKSGNSAETETTMGIDIPNDRQAMDIGPQTVRNIHNELNGAKLIFWNGPLGVFENPTFAVGTMKVAELLSVSPATTIIGGGDTVAAINERNLAHTYDHVSTGGGASMEFIEGKQLPGIAVLST